MEVILIKELKNKGKLGERINVKLGYAKNFLFPQGIAIPVSPQNIKRFEDLKKRELKNLAEKKKEYEAISKKINNKKIEVSLKTSKGKLYGSYTPALLIKEIEEKFGFILERQQLNMPDHIKEIGSYDIQIELHPEIACSIKLTISSSSEVSGPTDYEEAIALEEDSEADEEGSEEKIESSDEESKGQPSADPDAQETAEEKPETSESETAEPEEELTK